MTATPFAALHQLRLSALTGNVESSTSTLVLPAPGAPPSALLTTVFARANAGTRRPGASLGSAPREPKTMRGHDFNTLST